MFERFTDRSRRVVVLAQEEARRLGCAWVGTEHLLLGLVKEGEGVAAMVLTGMGVELDRLRLAVEEEAPGGEAEVSGHIPFTPRAKKVLELSLREALHLGHNYIGTEHLLLGLVREGEGVAWRVLTGFGVEAEAVRAAVTRSLRKAPAVEPEPSPAGPTCPWCRSALEGRIGWKDLTAMGDEGGLPQPVRVLFCGSCNACLGVAPTSGQ